MKKLLAVTFLPSKKGKSGNSTLFLTYDTFRKYFNLHLLCFIDKSELSDYKELRKLWPDVTFHVMISGLSMHSKFKKFAYKSINKIFGKSETLLNYGDLLKKRGRIANIKFEKIPPANVTFFNSVINSTKFDVVIVEFFQFIGYIDLIPKHIKKIFVHHEIRYKILEQELYLIKQRDEYLEYAVNWLKGIELNYLNKYDYILTMNEDDRNDLSGYTSEDKLIMTSAAPCLSLFDETKSYTYKNKLTFLGGSLHFPNVDAIEWFLNDIWDDVLKKYPDTVLNIIGYWEKSLIKRYSRFRNVSFMGFVDDLKSIISDSIFILPIRIGSGFRTKLVEALLYKLPVVSTEIGIQGFTFSDQSVLIADNTEKFIENILKLIMDEQFARNLIQNFEKEIQNNYNPLNVYLERAKILNELSED